MFFSPDNELQIYYGNVLLMDNKHWKLFVIKQSKGVQINLCLKMCQNTFGSRALPGPLGELMCSPDHLAAMGSPEGRRSTSKGERREERKDGKGGGRNSPKVKVSRIKHCLQQSLTFCTALHENAANYYRRSSVVSSLSVCLLVTTASPARPGELIKMSFGVWTRGEPCVRPI